MVMDSYFGVMLLTLVALLTGVRSYSTIAGNGDSIGKLLTATTPTPAPAPYDCPDTTHGRGCFNFMGEYDCSDKKLTCIQKWDNPLSKYSAVKTMNFKSNRLTHLPSNVFVQQYKDRAGLAEVTFLDLSFNQLNQIDSDAFEGFSALEVLSLVSNNLQQIPTGAFSGIRRLKHLNLRINSISMIPPHAFSPLKSLEKLELSFCHIATISPEAFMDLRSLVHLDLAQNHLDSNSITKNSFVDLPALGTVKLANNKDTFRLRDVNWMEAFGIGVPRPTKLRRSDEDEEEDYGDLLEFKTSSPDVQPDYYEVPCKCKRLSSDPPGTTTCPLIWKFFKANMTLECIGKAREPEYTLRGSTGLMAKSDQDNVEKPTAAVATEWSDSDIELVRLVWFLAVFVVNFLMMVLPKMFFPWF